jgi:hypothetical protein
MRTAFACVGKAQGRTCEFVVNRLKIEHKDSPYLAGMRQGDESKIINGGVST